MQKRDATGPAGLPPSDDAPREQFAMVPRSWFERQPRLSHRQFVVLVALRSFDNPKKPGDCFPAIATLAKLTGVDPSHVRRDLAAIARAGWIERRISGDGCSANVYLFLTEPQAETACPGEDAHLPNPRQKLPAPPQAETALRPQAETACQSDHVSDHVSNHSLRESSKKRSKRSRRPHGSGPNVDVDDATRDRSIELAEWANGLARDRGLVAKHRAFEKLVHEDLPAAANLESSYGFDEVKERFEAFLAARARGDVLRLGANLRGLERAWDWACLNAPQETIEMEHGWLRSGEYCAAPRGGPWPVAEGWSNCEPDGWHYDREKRAWIDPKGNEYRL